jgi:hypothetical protein
MMHPCSDQYFCRAKIRSWKVLGDEGRGLAIMSSRACNNGGEYSDAGSALSWSLVARSFDALGLRMRTVWGRAVAEVAPY